MDKKKEGEYSTLPERLPSKAHYQIDSPPFYQVNGFVSSLLRQRCRRAVAVDAVVRAALHPVPQQALVSPVFARLPGCRFDTQVFAQLYEMFLFRKLLICHSVHVFPFFPSSVVPPLG